MSHNVPTLSLEELNALSAEQKDAAMYNAITALTEEVAGLRHENVEMRRENAEIRRRFAALESEQQQQQQQEQQQQLALVPAPALAPTVAAATTTTTTTATTTTTNTAEKRCYICHEPGHVKRHCPERAGQPAPVPNFQGANVKIYNIYKGKGKDRGQGP